MQAPLTKVFFRKRKRKSFFEVCSSITVEKRTSTLKTVHIQISCWDDVARFVFSSESFSTIDFQKVRWILPKSAEWASLHKQAGKEETGTAKRDDSVGVDVDVDEVGPSRSIEREKQIELLRRARQKSQVWMEQAMETDTSATDSPKHSRLYEQLAASRNRLSRRLSEKNKYISFMENRMDTANETMEESYECFEQVIRELGTLSRLAENAAAAVQFGVDKEDAVEKILKLQQRLNLTQQAANEQKDLLWQKVPRRIPVSWYGVAEEVKVMGSFDNWTHGQELSANDVQDSVLSEFTGDLELLPGTYEVKFLVDGQWRLAPDWPTVSSHNDVTNNILVVD